MARYIDADKLGQRLAGYEQIFDENRDFSARNTILQIMHELNYTPAADVEEVKHGEWLDHEEMFYDGEFHSEYPMKGHKCSECGRVMWSKEPYCNCGAKMDGGKAE